MKLKLRLEIIATHTSFISFGMMQELRHSLFHFFLYLSYKAKFYSDKYGG